MTDRRIWQRRALLITYWLCGVVAVVVCVVLGTNSLQDNNAYSGIASLLLGLVTTFVAVVGWLRRGQRVLKAEEAEQELVTVLRTYWEQELTNRRSSRTDAPRTVPLTWRTTQAQVPGRLDKDPDAAANTLANLFENGKVDRYVVLGEPGVGKTFLAIMLAVGLLRRWAPGKRIPVFLSLASWDPIVESLDAWMVREIGSLYLGGRTEVVKDLLLRRQVLPILDGLDELPEHTRRPAVTRINRTLDGDRQLVLTCRKAEYEEEIAGGAPVLLGAGIVEILPLTVDDIRDFLGSDPAWANLASFVEVHRDSPLVEALSTPLMLTLYGSAYHDRAPDDLLTEPLSTRHEVEDYLVDQLLDTAYPATPARWGGWTSAKARRWLTYLAEHLHAKKTRDLSPWRLAADLAVQMVGPLAVLLCICLHVVLARPHVVISMAMVGLVACTFAIALVRRVPGRFAVDKPPNAETFRFGMAVGTVTGLSGSFFILLLIFLSGPIEVVDIAVGSAASAAFAALGLITGLGFGLNELMVASLLRRGNAKVAGRDFLARDRSSSLRATVMATVFVGVLAVPCAAVVHAYGYYLGQRVAVATGMNAVIDAHFSMVVDVTDDLFPSGSGELVSASLWYAAVFACAVLSTRTWTWLLLLRATHAPARKLPWRLMAFLEDARARGLFRGAGGYYQFGHVRLQDRLVATAVQPRDRKNLRTVRVVAAAAVAILLAGGLVWTWAKSPSACRPLGWSQLDTRMRNVVTDGETGCFVTLGQTDWRVLASMSADPARLASLATAQPAEDDYHDTVYIAGDLAGLQPIEWDGLLDGISTAKQESTSEVEIVFVHADAEDVAEPEVARLTADFVRSENETRPDEPLPVVHVGLSGTWMPVKESASSVATPVIGRAGDVEAVVQRQAARDVQDFLDANDGDPLALVNGVSDAECRALGTENAAVGARHFDLRTVPNAVDVLSAVARCGPADVLVDYAMTRSLRPVAQQLLDAGVVPQVDIGEAIRLDCEDRTKPRAPAREYAIATCVAVTAAYRIDDDLVTNVLWN